MIDFTAYLTGRLKSKCRVKRVQKRTYRRFMQLGCFFSTRPPVIFDLLEAAILCLGHQFVGEEKCQDAECSKQPECARLAQVLYEKQKCKSQFRGSSAPRAERLTRYFLAAPAADKCVQTRLS